MPAIEAKKNVPASAPMIFAHRGLSSTAPENTMVAFERAVAAGATWIETDVDIAADGTVVIIHDSTLDRTTDRSGSIYNLTAQDLETIDAGSWFGAEFAGEKLPTLAQLIDFANEHAVNLNVEIKQNEQGAAQTIALVDGVAAQLARLNPEREVIISSFSQPLLMKFHERHPDYAIGVLYETVALYDDWRSVLELCGASFIHPEDKKLTQEKVAQFKAEGYGVNVWTVNDPARAQELLEWGCAGVFTDVAENYTLR